jgi:hypothetical protein
LGQVQKNGLRNILGAMGISVDQAEGRRIDEIQVARDKFAKSRFGAVFHEFSEQCLSLSHLFRCYNAAEFSNPPLSD